MALGVSKKNAETIAAETKDDGATIDQKDIDAFVAAQKEAQMELIKNDADFIATIESPLKAKYSDIQMRKLKQTFGLTADDVKDLSYEDALKLGKDKVAASGNATTKELQDANIALAAENKKLKEEDIPAIKLQVENERKLEQRKSAFLKEFDTTKLGDKKLRVAMIAAAPALEAYMNDKYDWTLKEDGTWDVLVKGTQLKPTNEDKTKVLTFEEIKLAKLKEWQMIEESNASNTQQKRDNQGNVIVDGNEGAGGAKPKNTSPHLVKAEKNLAENKAAIEANK